MSGGLSKRVRRVRRTLYQRFIRFRQRLELTRLWRRTRRARGETFFPAVNKYELSTPDYLKRAGNASPSAQPKVIHIPDASYFDPPPPNTSGVEVLGNQLTRLNLPLSVARLDDVRVFGDAGDVVTRDNVLLADISFRRPTLMWHERGEHALLEQEPLPEARTLPGQFALLTSRYAGANYFHWLFNALPRLCLLERAGIRRDEFDGYLLNRIELPAIREMLVGLGIPPSWIVEMDEQAALQIKALWVTPSLLATGHRRPFIQDWLRANFLPPASAKPARRLFLSRADTVERRMSNEHALWEILEPLGFESVLLGGCSVTAQASLFAQAETIVAPHGGALANLVFCAPGTRVVELIRADRLRTFYWELSACRGLDYYYALCQPDPRPSPLRVHKLDTWMPPDAFRSILKKAKII